MAADARVSGMVWVLSSVFLLELVTTWCTHVGGGSTMRVCVCVFQYYLIFGEVD